ncbi:MAG: hypothetical protein ACREEA_10480 [Stellaceae bacterium]
MRETRTLGGGILGFVGSGLTAIASGCCVVPVVTGAIVGALGASGSVALESLVPYRPWLLLASGIALLVALYVIFAQRQRTCPPSRFVRSLGYVSRVITFAGAALWLVALGLTLTIFH